MPCLPGHLGGEEDSSSLTVSMPASDPLPRGFMGERDSAATL